MSAVPDVPSGATVWRVLYHSRSLYGTDIAVSGYVVVPAGRPPKGGFPVISWAHGTTGINDPCAPSLFSDLEGASGPYLVPDLGAYLSAGFEVAATDYQGLGTPGPHPYLVGVSEGRAVLDAARAAEHLPGAHASRDVMIFGHSQGGQAALFAGELAPDYAPDLHVIGVVAAAPATNLSGIMGLADSTTFGQSILVFTLPAAFTWAQTYRDLPMSVLFSVQGEKTAEALLATGCLSALEPRISAGHLTPSDLFAPGIDSDPVVASYAKLNNPGRSKTRAPLLVVQGTTDMVVPPALTDAFVQSTACPIRDVVDYLHVTGATHFTVVYSAEPVVLAWMQQRLDGTSAPSTCGGPGDLMVYTPGAS